MNGFVDYLNSTNNVGGNSTGSLAETQVKSSYFDMVKIDRKLGQNIANTIKTNNYKLFILTGHAGDGKTSVLVQVLKNLKLLRDGEGLVQKKEYDDFFYVKDMSEIAEQEQEKVLKQALEAPKNGKSSLLISNTGPLLNTFLRLAEYNRRVNLLAFDDKEKMEVRSKLLIQLDTNSDEMMNLEGFEFYLVNIARVDNVNFSKDLLQKILSDQLWNECQSCSCKDRCPIKNNVDSVKAQLDRVASFVKSYYRYLYENDKRMTIRQMVGQIAYAVTGNLTCQQISSHYLKEPFFNYNFANLFFGYNGLNEALYSPQIKGIAQINLLGLDRISLDVDYRLFVNHDYSFFTSNIADILDSLRKKHRKHYQVVEKEQALSVAEQSKEAKMRQAIRRFYLVYSADQKEEDVFNQIFGHFYTLYEKLVSSKQPQSVLRKIQALLFQALYIKNTGFLPNHTNDLPLTLRRENDVFQNVMLVLGVVSKMDLDIRQKQVNNCFEDFETKQVLYLHVKDEDFVLTLPMLTYFENMVQGAIVSENNPALTHGIAKLDALLLDKFGDDLPESKDDCILRILINTTRGQVIRCYAFNGSKLSFMP